MVRGATALASLPLVAHRKVQQGSDWRRVAYTQGRIQRWLAGGGRRGSGISPESGNALLSWASSSLPGWRRKTGLFDANAQRVYLLCPVSIEICRARRACFVSENRSGRTVFAALARAFVSFIVSVVTRN